jgi:integrase
MAVRHIVQQSSGYCFRMVVPADLRPVIGKSELRYSLHERSLLHAKRKAHRISTQVKGLFAKLRKGNGNMDQAQINRLIRNLIKTSIAEMEHEKATGKMLDRGELNEYLSDLDLFEHDYREALSLRDYRLIYPVVDFMIEEGNLDVKKGSEGYLRLAAEVLKAQIHLLQVDRKQSTGDYSYQFKEPFSMPQDEPETTSEIISKVATEYWDEKSPSWSPRTVPDYRIFKDTLIDFLGKNTMIHSVDYDNGRDYKAHLDTLKNAKGKPLSDSRKDSYLGFAKQLWKWAIQHHYADTNPFDGLQVGKAGRKRADQQRAAFTQDDLKTIFCDSKEYGKDRITRPDYFWVPLLGLFTGCRLEELCQAYVKDIKQEEGVWVLDVVADEPDKTIKTGERRLVPLHDTLIDLGFLKYVQSLPKNGRLFPKFKRINNRYGHAFGQWFSNFKKRIGIAPNQTFHSFRHTVATHLAERDIPDHRISMLLGHALEGQTKGRYIKRFQPKMLKEKVVDHIDYGIDLEHLKRSKFVVA